MSKQGRFNMKEVSIDSIIPNHKRDFEVYPINEEVVEGLIQSYAQTGDFGVLPVREVGDRRYEQACGHHRLEAMKRLGHVNVEVKIAPFSDEEMRQIMINENATQAGGNPAAIADSVLAVVTDLAYALFASESEEELLEISKSYGPVIGHGHNAFKLIKQKALRGEVSSAVVCVAMGGKWTSKGAATKGNSPLGADAIGSSLSQLTADGVLFDRIMRQKDRYDREMKVKSLEAERKAKALKEKEEAAARQAKEAEEARKIAAEHAEKARKAKAEAEALRAEQEAERLKRQAELREKERARLEAERKEREQAAAIAALKRKEEAEAREAARKKAEEARYLAKGLQEKFRNNAQFDAYRSIVKGHARLFPIAEQLEFVGQMMTTLAIVDGKEDAVTAKSIKAYMQTAITQRDASIKAEYEAAMAEKEADAIKQATSNLAAKIHRELGTAIGRMAAVVRELDKYSDDPEFVDAFFRQPHGLQVPGQLESLHRNIPSLCNKLNIAQSRVCKADINTTFEKVINS